MSQLTNNAYVARSMNGIISIDDGAGGTMEGGVITANELMINAIQSKSPPNVVSLFTDTTTVINVGSSTSTLNVSNLNVSNINVPLVTFTTLNASTVNSQTSNTSTSNSSTSNSSTSNSSTSNSSTSNSSTSNSGTANNGTTNSSTVNVSTLNFGTTSGTTINMSTVNASLVKTNEIQGITAGDDITLFANTIGNVTLGDTTTNLTHLKGISILLESAGDTYLQTTNNLYLSTFGNTTINGSSLLIGANVSNTVGDITVGNVSANSLTLYSKNTLVKGVNDVTLDANGEIYLNSNGNTHVCGAGLSGKLVLAGNQQIRANDRSMPSYLFTDAFSGGDVNFGNASNTLYLGCPLSSSKSIKGTDLIGTTLNISTTANISTLNVSTLNASTTTFGTINNTTINASTLNASTANISTLNASTTTFGTINNTTINTSTLNASTANISFLKTSNISSVSSSATNNLYPDSTTGILNICTNYTNGAINIGNATDVGSLSLSQGTINLNPKTTLNLANQIGTGTANICNSSTFNGTLNIGATLPTSGVNTINLGSNSTALNLKCPLIPLYTPVATNGTSIGDVGYTYYQTTVTAGTFLTNAITTSLTQSVPAGIWFVYAVVPIRCTINNTLTYQQVAISDTGSTFFYALSSSFCSHNPPTVNGDCWYSCSGIAVLTATTTLIATIKMTFNVVGAYTRFGQFARLSATRIA